MSEHELLKKLKRLSELGYGGEKINAQRLLTSYMEKYAITEAELNEEETTLCQFKFKTTTDEKLLDQIIYKVTNSTQIYGYFSDRQHKRTKKLAGCYCTQAQRIEIEFLFDFYKRLFEKDLGLFFSAFVQKHKLFGQLKDGEKPTESSRDHLFRMAAMMDGMSDETPLKQLEGGGND